MNLSKKNKNALFFVGMITFTIIVFLIQKSLTKNENFYQEKKLKSKKRVNRKVRNREKKHIEIQYFGCSTCPHSSERSRIYNFLINKFSKNNPNIKLNIYWSTDPKSHSKFQEYNIRYIPTLIGPNGEIEVNQSGTDEEMEEQILNGLK